MEEWNRAWLHRLLWHWQESTALGSFVGVVVTCLPKLLTATMLAKRPSGRTTLAERTAGGIPVPARWMRAPQTSWHWCVISPSVAPLWRGTAPIGAQNPCFLPASQQHDHIGRTKQHKKNKSETILPAGTVVLEGLPKQFQQQRPRSIERVQVLPFEKVSGPVYAKWSLLPFAALQYMLMFLELKL